MDNQKIKLIDTHLVDPQFQPVVRQNNANPQKDFVKRMKVCSNRIKQYQGRNNNQKKDQNQENKEQDEKEKEKTEQQQEQKEEEQKENKSCVLPSDLLFSISENNFISIHDIQNGKIDQLYKSHFGNPIYDIETMQYNNHNENRCVIISIKDQPMTIFRMSTNEAEEQVQKQEEQELEQDSIDISLDSVQNKENELKNKMQLTFIGEISDQKPMSEQYWAPLQMKTYRNNLVGVGNGFARIYDINKQKVKGDFAKIGKRDPFSCIDIQNMENPDFACLGRFDRKVQLFCLKTQKKVSDFGAHVGGVTFVKFSSSDENYLYTGARKDDVVYQWDRRKPDNFVKYYERKCTTNQRLSFDLYRNESLFLGHEDGKMKVHNIESSKIVQEFQAHDDVINSIICYENESDGKTYLISSSGQRRFQFQKNPKIHSRRNIDKIKKDLQTPVQDIQSDASSVWSDFSDSEQEVDGIHINKGENRDNSIKLWEYL